MVRYSNGQLALPLYCALKTGPFFEWLKTRWLILPFENWTQIVAGKLPFEYPTVRFSMVTVLVFYHSMYGVLQLWDALVNLFLNVKSFKVFASHLMKIKM
jgi:hypothetical protein